MQDIDLYTGKQNSYFQPSSFDTTDPEFFTRMSAHVEREQTHTHKKAARLITFIIALCIVSFTGGMVTGIKFAGGEQKTLVDPHTKKAVASLGQRVSGMMDTATPAQAAEPVQNASAAYPKAEYPFVVRVGNEFTKDKATDAGEILSAKGHQVVISKRGTSYRVYAGPFKTMESAEISLQKIKGYHENRWQNNAVILKRE